MTTKKFFDIATNALLNNGLYGVSKEEKIVNFLRSEDYPIYLLSIIRKLNFFTTESPTTALFALEIPYEVELNIEDDIELIDHEKGLENFWYSIKEVSPEIRMFDANGHELKLDLDLMDSADDFDWQNRDFLHRLCHASVFHDLLDENDSIFKFYEQPNTKTHPFLMDKLNLEQYLLLDLKCVLIYEFLLS
jgi:hypothetical protein